MKQLLLKCDFLGFSPILHIRNKTSFESIFTGFLSLIVILVSLLTLGYFSSELFTKSTPSVIVTRDIYDNFGPIEVSNKEFLVIAGLQDQMGSFYIDSTIYEVTASCRKINYVESKNGDKEQKLEFLELNIDVCSKFYKKGDYVEDNIDIALNYTFCIQPNQAQIKGFWGTDQSSIRISFDKCENSTANNNHCKSIEEIDNHIQNGFISMDYSTFEVDQNNHNTPLRKIFYDDYNLINANSSLQYSIELHPLKFKTDEGLIFPDIQEFEGFDHHIKIFSQNTRSRNIVNLNFQGNGIATVFMRNYVKLQTVITQIGGFIKFIMLAAQLMSQLFSINYFFAEILFESVEKGNSSKKLIQDLSSIAPIINKNLNNFNKLRNFNYDKINENRNVSSNNNLNSNNPYIENVTSSNIPKINQNSKFVTTRKSNKFESVKITNTDMNIHVYIKDSSPSKIMLRYLKNKFCFWKSEARGMQFKMMKNLDDLYRQSTSIDFIIKKFFVLEMLTCISMGNEFNLEENFYKTLISTVINTNVIDDNNNLFIKSFTI